MERTTDNVGNQTSWEGRALQMGTTHLEVRNNNGGQNAQGGQLSLVPINADTGRSNPPTVAIAKCYNTTDDYWRNYRVEEAITAIF